jgi:hypothetical protein
VHAAAPDRIERYVMTQTTILLPRHVCRLSMMYPLRYDAIARKHGKLSLLLYDFVAHMVQHLLDRVDWYKQVTKLLIQPTNL